MTPSLRITSNGSLSGTAAYYLPIVVAALLVISGVSSAASVQAKSPPSPTTRLEVLNLVPDAAGHGLLFYVDGGVFSGPITYAGSSAFGSLKSGIHRVQVGRAHGPLLFTLTAPLHSNQSYTFIALGAQHGHVGGLLLPITWSPGSSTKAAVRFVNALPTAATLVASLERRGPVFGATPFGVVSKYQIATAGSYALRVRTPAGATLLAGPRITVQAGKTYTIYVLATLKSSPAPSTMVLVFNP